MRTAYVYPIHKRLLFFAAVAFILVMNYLSFAIPFGGQSNAEVSAAYPTLLTPASYAFSIWSVIYISLIVFAFFQYSKGKELRFYKLIWPYFMVNALANGLWLVAFQNEWFFLSFVLIGILLGTLFAKFRLFYRLKSALSTTHRYFFHLPFGIYFAWVSVATILNAAILISSLEISFFQRTDELWALIMIVIALGVAMYVLLSQKDYIFALTFVWAFSAIMFGNYDVDLVRYPAKIAGILLLASSAVLFTSDRIRMAQYGQSRS